MKLLFIMFVLYNEIDCELFFRNFILIIKKEKWIKLIDLFDVLEGGLKGGWGNKIVF